MRSGPGFPPAPTPEHPVPPGVSHRQFDAARGLRGPASLLTPRTLRSGGWGGERAPGRATKGPSRRMGRPGRGRAGKTPGEEGRGESGPPRSPFGLRATRPKEESPVGDRNLKPGPSSRPPPPRRKRRDTGSPRRVPDGEEGRRRVGGDGRIYRKILRTPGPVPMCLPDGHPGVASDHRRCSTTPLPPTVEGTEGQSVSFPHGCPDPRGIPGER